MQLRFGSPQHGFSDVGYRSSSESAMEKAGVPHSQLGPGASPRWAKQLGMLNAPAPLSQLDSGPFPSSIGFSSSSVVSQLRFGHSVRQEGLFNSVLCHSGYGSSHSSTKTPTLLMRTHPCIVTCEQANPKHEQQTLYTPNSSNGRLELPHSPSGQKYLVVEEQGYASPHTHPKPRNPRVKHLHSFEEEAWELLRAAVVNYCGNPVGTIAANDPTDCNPLNYDQVFIRDFIPSAMAFLLNGEHEIVRNFLLHTLQLQSWEKTVDCYDPGQGLMPASFKVRVIHVEENGANNTEEVLDPDFGESAIGRVAPVDSGLWWIILLRAYGLSTGDFSFQERVDVQTGIRMILKLCLTDEFDMFPTLLVTDGSCMIDRRMGIHGHPLEIQALFYSALLCGREILQREDSGSDLIREIDLRLLALSFHIREYYWVDLRKLNEIYRYKTEEYSLDAINKFNIYPDQISPWLVDWMPDQGGYLIGNLQPAHMDFRFFSLGNLWAIVSSLATQEQAGAILDLVEARWDDLIGNMPFKICFPALEGEDWSIITGRDPKNTSLSLSLSLSLSHTHM